MSDTPRTDAITLDSRGAAGVLEDHHALCIALEREITALQSELASERIKREAAERRLALVKACTGQQPKEQQP